MVVDTELERLRDRVAELEGLLGVRRRRQFTIPGVEIACWTLADLLAKWPIITKDFAFIVIYGGKPEADQPVSDVIGQSICRLRRALKPYGVVINTERHRGYYCDQENRKRLAALVRHQIGGLRADSATARRDRDRGNRTVASGSGSSSVVSRASVGLASDSMEKSRH